MKKIIHFHLRLIKYPIRKLLNVYRYIRVAKLSPVEKWFYEKLRFFKVINDKPNGILLIQMVEDYFFTIKLAAASKVLAEKHNLEVCFYSVLIDWITNKKINSRILPARRRKLKKINTSFAKKMIFDSNQRYHDQSFIRAQMTQIEKGIDPDNPESLLGLKFEDLLIGDLIYDSYLRFYDKVTMKNIDSDVLHMVEVGLNVYYSFKYFLKNNPIKMLVTTYVTYVHHGIVARLCLKNNIPTYSTGSYYYALQEVTKEYPWHTINHTLFDPEKKLNDEQKSLVDQQFTFRFSGKSDSATSYMKQSSYFAAPLDEKVKTLFSKRNRNVVIYTHELYDSPHVYRELQFPDLYQYLRQTLEEFVEEKNISFFIKIHPNGRLGTKEKTIQLVNSFGTEHFHILDENVSNHHVVSIKPDLIATARGTICLEMAYWGIPTVALYDNPFVNFKFAHTCKNKEEYFQILRGNKQPVIEFEREKILSFYYQAYLEKILDEQLENIHNLLFAPLNIDEFTSDYLLQSIKPNEDKIFSIHFLNQYEMNLLN